MESGSQLSLPFLLSLQDGLPSAQTLIDLKLSQAAMLLSTIVDNLANPLTATLTTQPTSGLPDILIFLKNLCLG